MIRLLLLLLIGGAAVAQPLQLVQLADVVFVLDRSGSVGAANFEIEKGFVESFLAQVAVEANATRVAVISYSNTAEVHIDYLRDPKTKCHLSRDLQDVVYQDSKATNIHAALESARQVLTNARPQAHKVVVLITDGEATAGAPPGEAARRLKEEGVELFCFGVGRQARRELLALASTPEHVYSCPEFKDFQRLARRIRGDPHESSWSGGVEGCDHLCDSPYRGEADDPGCCDRHALCSCALLAGLRTCVCAPGYYGLSGLAGRCSPCPRGTYKSKLEPTSACSPCPKGSTTLSLASTSSEQCVCQEGFQRTGEECTRVRCPPLQAPPGGFLLRCGREFGDECLFACAEGFEVAGDDIRTCRSDATWSGETTRCQRVQCLHPPASSGLQVRCSSRDPHFPGARCRFSCVAGHLLQGSHERECLDTKRWSGTEPSCVPVSCPLPPALRHGSSSCTARPRFREACFLRCNHGFRLVGPPVLYCADDGRLTPHQPVPHCQDVQPPELLCPAPVAVAAEPGRDGALVQWAAPLLSDNSHLPPTLHPPAPLPPLYLHLGTHTRLYVATDHAGLQTTCTSIVRVYDDEPPRVLRCPPNIEVSSDDLRARVFWEEPLFKDNSGRKLKIEQTHHSGDFFPLEVETVTYRAIDDFNNAAECKFEVKVKRTDCPYHPPPANGALSCDDLLFGSFCEVFCEDRFDFVARPADLYVCDTAGHWITDPAHMPFPWPDCTRPVHPGMVRLMAHGFYFRGDCGSAEAQMQIRKQFVMRLMESNPKAAHCFHVGACSVHKVRVHCGKTTAPRKRRDLTSGEDMELEFEITLNDDLQLNDTDAVLQDFLETIRQLRWEEEEGGGEVLITEEEVVCRRGSVLADNGCLLCPSGTFFDGGECAECPLGHFQREEGQLECDKCPDGTSTERPRAKNDTECRGVCPPGTFSESGLETCLACPLGTFQEQAGQRECLPCPPSSPSTLFVHSSSPTDCKESCVSGFFSEGGGLSPCSPCPLGTFQPSSGQMACLECPGNLSTRAEASTDVAQCTDEVCPPGWCLHWGSCEGLRACACPEGREGPRCEKDVDECQLQNPCGNGGTCLNTDGSFRCSCSDGFIGPLCLDEVDECLSSPCLNNGTCLDQVNGFSCACGRGFSGPLCELCTRHGVACANGGRCVPSGDEETACACAPGYSGVDCSLDLDECEGIVCLNNGSCVDGVASYECACVPGYTGALCEVEVDECVSNRCAEGATCKDLVADYECLCPPGWGGPYCETKLSDDFVLHFPEEASLANLASVRMRSPLSEVTVSLWVQTTDPAASALSYAATGADGAVVDNALTLSDCGALTLSLNNEPLLTDVAVHDGRWHHLAFAWSSDNQGSWQLYKDGRLEGEGTHLRPGERVAEGGTVVLGQEQDTIGGGFSPAETFTGNITRVNVWSSSFSASNVSRLCQLDDDIPGKVVAWPDFLSGVSGDVRVLSGQTPPLQ